MKRSRLRNKFSNSKSDIDRKAYNKQRNYCVSLIRREKKEFFSKLNTADISDNKVFWNKIKPLFTDKIKSKSKITLIEKELNKDSNEIISEKITSNDNDVVETFNKFFVNIVPNLKIPTNHDFDINFKVTGDPIVDAINKYENHPSITMIKNKNKTQFSFTVVEYDDILKKVKKLNTSKATKQSDIPTKILRENNEFFARFFHENFNLCIDVDIFPSDLKIADVTPAYKKKSKYSKDNYRPVSILSNISKIYERCIYDQIEKYFDDILSKYQCGFRKGYSAQHCLMSLIEKWKESVDSCGAFGALLTDLS